MTRDIECAGVGHFGWWEMTANGGTFAENLVDAKSALVNKIGE